MGFNLGGSKKSSSSSSTGNMTQDALTNMSSTGVTNRVGNRNATFNTPGAQELLSYLQGATMQPGGVGNYGTAAGAAYGGLASDLGGGNNPFIDEIINRSNAEADRTLAGGLAKVRAGGFRGGTGANMYGQGRLVADAANSRARDNATLRSGAYEAAQGRALTSRLAGASGLAGLEGQDNASRQAMLQQAMQLLAMLRGESLDENSTTNTTGTSNTRTVGTQSATSKGSEGGFNFGLNWGS